MDTGTRMAGRPMNTTPDMLSLLELAGEPVTALKGMRLGWRNTHPDLTSRNRFQWAFPGGVTVAPDDGRDLTTNHPTRACPTDTIGGLCLAKTWVGARSGGIPSNVCLVVAYRKRDVLGEDDIKLRVREATTLAVVDVAGLVCRANLTGANLAGASLAGADLTGANLTGAYLTGANLARAYLARASLAGANLARAYLARASLAGADLTGANLTGAYLARASLAGADLAGAYADRWTRLPAGYAVVDGRVVAS